jgi:hypothetical protein
VGREPPRGPGRGYRQVEGKRRGLNGVAMSKNPVLEQIRIDADFFQARSGDA